MFRLSRPRPRRPQANRFRAALIPAGIAAAAAVLLPAAGCGSQRPENSPYLEKKFGEIEQRLQTLAGAERSVMILEGTVEDLSAQVSSLSLGAAGLTPDQQQGLTSLPESLAKISKLEAELAAAQGKIAQLELRLVSGDPGSSRVSPAIAAAAARVAAGSSSTPAPVSGQSATIRQVASSGASRAANKPARKGFWHKVQPNETLGDVAQRHGVTAAQLASANRLPAGVRLAPGQSIWVP
jgi:LysM repeat protein